MINTDIKFKLNQIHDLLSSSRKVLIATHKDPDGDGIGSMLALNLALKKDNIDVYLFCQDSPPAELNFLPYWHEIQTNCPQKRYDIIVALDYGNFERTGLVLEPENIQTPLITIDHHPLNNHKGHIQIVEPQFSSTSEIVYHLFREKNIEIDKNIATCLLAGIFFDTGGFRHSNTSQDTLKAAGDLLAKNGDLARITENTQGVKSEQCSKLWGKILSNLEFLEDSGMIFVVVTRDDLEKYNASNEDLDGLVNLICAIPEAKFSLFLSEEPNGYFRGSLRSEEFKNVDVSEIAQIFGGGGHRLAAGFTVNLRPEEITAKIAGYHKSLN